MVNINRPNPSGGDLSVNSDQPSTSDTEPKKVSSSKRKVGKYLSEYDNFADDNTSVTDLINLKDMESLLSNIAVCTKCNSTLLISSNRRLGLEVLI